MNTNAPPAVPMAETLDGQDGLGSRIKAASQVAAMQAHRAKMTTLTIPAAYRALGKQVYSAKAFRDDFPEKYKQFDQLTAELQAIKTDAAARPTADGITANAKAAALGAKDMAQKKAVEFKVNQAFTALGEAVFLKHGNNGGTPEVVAAIVNAKAQVAQLDSDIAKISSEKGSKPTWRVIIENPVVIGILSVCCFPIGLALVWLHSAWTKKTKLVWTGAWAGLMVICIIVASAEKAAAKKSLEQANMAWDSGHQSDAVDGYKGLINGHLDDVPESDKATMFQRVIEFDVNHGNNNEAKVVIHDMIRDNISPPFENGAAIALIAEVRSELNSSSVAKDKPDESQKTQPKLPDGSAEFQRGYYQGNLIVAGWKEAYANHNAERQEQLMGMFNDKLSEAQQQYKMFLENTGKDSPNTQQSKGMVESMLVGIAEMQSGPK